MFRSFLYGLGYRGRGISGCFRVQLPGVWTKYVYNIVFNKFHRKITLFKFFKIVLCFSLINFDLVCEYDSDCCYYFFWWNATSHVECLIPSKCTLPQTFLWVCQRSENSPSLDKSVFLCKAIRFCLYRLSYKDRNTSTYLRIELPKMWICVLRCDFRPRSIVLNKFHGENFFENCCSFSFF